MSEYTPNSHKYHNEQKERAQKVTTGVVKTKKKSSVSKLADVFIAEDIGSVKSYVWTDVLVPAFKKTLYDAFTNGLDMLLNGATGRSYKKGSSGFVSYSDFSKREGNSPSEPKTRTRFSYDDIAFESRGEAEEVLTRMDEILATYKQVSIADMYDLAGISCPYTYNDYGWTNINNAEIVRTRDGDYIIKLPRVTPIK